MIPPNLALPGILTNHKGSRSIRFNATAFLFRYAKRSYPLSWVEAVGRALLSRVASIAQQESCFGVMLHVLGWNETAIQFYKKMDATFLDDWKTVCLKGNALRLVARSGDH